MKKRVQGERMYKDDKKIDTFYCGAILTICEPNRKCETKFRYGEEG